ncbi:MAG: universal stress protein [Myxococcales bacterium]|nr:universal stress protein [Myxococcales bacterium]
MKAGPIVLATDLTDGSCGAAIWARDMSTRTGLPVVVVHVVELGFDNWLHGKYQIADDAEMHATAVHEVRAWYEGVAGRLPEEVEVKVGHAVTELRAIPVRLGASMLVMAASAKSALTRVVVGSRVQQIIAEPTVPVVIVDAESYTVESAPRVVAAVDFSPTTDEVVAVAGTFARLAQGSLTLAHVVEGEGEAKPDADCEARLAALAERVLPGFLHVDSAVLHGPPARALEALAREGEVDVMVLGHTGHAPSARALLGSTPRKLSAHPPCTLVIAPTNPRYDDDAVDE